jgi:hypothetical protein
MLTKEFRNLEWEIVCLIVDAYSKHKNYNHLQSVLVPEFKTSLHDQTTHIEQRIKTKIYKHYEPRYFCVLQKVIIKM